MCLWVTSQCSLTRKSSTLSHTHPALAEYLPWAPMNQHFTCQPFNNDMNVHVNALWCPTAAVFHPPTQAVAAFGGTTTSPLTSFTPIQLLFCPQLFTYCSIYTIPAQLGGHTATSELLPPLWRATHHGCTTERMPPLQPWKHSVWGSKSTQKWYTAY